MAKVLDVYFKQKIIGELTQDDDGQMKFTYLSSWLNDPDAIAISYSLPLEKKRFYKKNVVLFLPVFCWKRISVN